MKQNELRPAGVKEVSITNKKVTLILEDRLEDAEELEEIINAKYSWYTSRVGQQAG